MPTIFIKLKIIPEKIAITAPKERKSGTKKRLTIKACDCWRNEIEGK